MNVDVNHVVDMLSVVMKGVPFSEIIRFSASQKHKEWKAKLRLACSYIIMTQYMIEIKAHDSFIACIFGMEIP